MKHHLYNRTGKMWINDNLLATNYGARIMADSRQTWIFILNIRHQFIHIQHLALLWRILAGEKSKVYIVYYMPNTRDAYIYETGNNAHRRIVFFALKFSNPTRFH